MYAVIFRSTIRQLDQRYYDMAEQLREKAVSYGCVEFTSIQEGDQEIAISYWPDLDAIQAWKQDELHLRAQQLGQSDWYSAYQVDVVKVERTYGKGEGRD